MTRDADRTADRFTACISRKQDTHARARSCPRWFARRAKKDGRSSRGALRRPSITLNRLKHQAAIYFLAGRGSRSVWCPRLLLMYSIIDTSPLALSDISQKKSRASNRAIERITRRHKPVMPTRGRLCGARTAITAQREARSCHQCAAPEARSALVVRHHMRALMTSMTRRRTAYRRRRQTGVRRHARDVITARDTNAADARSVQRAAMIRGETGVGESGWWSLRKGSRWWESNPQPRLYESRALPLSYIGDRSSTGQVPTAGQSKMRALENQADRVKKPR